MSMHLKGVPVNHLGVYTVASAPTTGVTLGATVYLSDALKGAETTGNGTGNLAFWDGAWKRVDTGAAVGA